MNIGPTVNIRSCIGVDGERGNFIFIVRVGEEEKEGKETMLHDDLHGADYCMCMHQFKIICN